MAVEFRCEKCGKVLVAKGAGETEIRCPYCKAKVAIPAALASLPQPKVPPGSSGRERPEVPQPAAQATGAEEPEPPDQQDDAVMTVMAMVMPWVISVFFHVGVLVIFAFIAIVVQKPKVSPGSEPNARLTPKPTERMKLEQLKPDESNRDMQDISKNRWGKRDTKMPTADLGKTQNPISVFGIAGPGAMGSGAFGLKTGGKGPTEFYGSGGNAHHVVFVVDKSGSMMESFDSVKKEMIRSISRLGEEQTFHVIFFVKGEPDENPARQLVRATKKHKAEAAAYMKPITAAGGSPTNPIAALRRAFQVLDKPPNDKPGKLIYLLTDGEFHDNDQVLKTVKDLNKMGDVYVNTFMYHYDAPQAVSVLKDIANDTGGDYTFVPANR